MNLPRTRRGEQHPNSRLTRDQIAAAALIARAEDLTPAQIVARLELRCSKWTLARALKGETYRDD